MSALIMQVYPERLVLSVAEVNRRVKCGTGLSCPGKLSKSLSCALPGSTQ